MRNLRAPLFLLALCFCAVIRPAAAQETPPPTLDIDANTASYYDETNGIATATNGVTVKYTDTTGVTVLTADSAKVNEHTGDIFASGAVRIQRENETWTGDSLTYNYLTKKMSGDDFRMGKSPAFVAGQQLHGMGVGEGTNSVYQSTNTFITTDDYFVPLLRVRAKRFVIVPGKYVEAHNATLCLGDVPVFYFPYYRQSLVRDPDHFDFLPGYRSLYGPYLLTTYEWLWNDQLSGGYHLDYRERRGLGTGPDFNFRFGPWGDGTNSIGGTNAIPNNRDRTYFSYNAQPLTNLTIMSQVAQQSDAFVVRDFFEGQYRKDNQPNTFVSASKFWQNWGADAIVQPRVNPFWETVERLPEVRLNGYSQQIGDTPFYYESQSSIGYYDRLFGNTTNFFSTMGATNFAATRADTFHQITMPETFFGWLNVTPRVGGRYTYYDSASGPGATTTNQNRGVFNTGGEVSFTASRLWAGAHSDFWDVDGLRHIFQPSLDYVYIPRPDVLPSQVPQFDYEPSNLLRLPPIDFPDNNSIDSINSENTIRYGLNNRLQTKRNGEVEDLLTSSIYMDWNLRPRTDQTTFSDIYSEFTLKPRSWLTFNSATRYSIAQDRFNLAQHSIVFQPNNTWNWSLGHLYLRTGSIFGQGDDLITSIFFYRLNENWGSRIGHSFDARSGTLQSQEYSIYRDMRSWTAALTFRVLNNIGTGSSGTDYGVAFTFSFKSFPRFKTGGDTVRASSLVGY
jgi:LPS-assembly protein